MYAQVEPHLLAEPLPPPVVDQIARLGGSAVQEKVKLSRTLDSYALRVLPATAQQESSCM